MSHFSSARRVAAAALALPSQCAVCLSWSHDRICPACRARFAPPMARCTRCALRVPEGVAICGRCLRRPPPFDGAVAAVDYAYPWSLLITRFKFAAALDLAEGLTQLMSTALAAAQSAPTAELLLPVPLGAARLRQRGYNQSWELSRRLARQLGLSSHPDLLLRMRETPPQLDLALDQRAANVNGAFAVEPTRRAEVQGRRLAVVDDVMTTGETAAELTRVLRAAGAASVHIWVVGRTPAPMEELP